MRNGDEWRGTQDGVEMYGVDDLRCLDGESLLGLILAYTSCIQRIVHALSSGFLDENLSLLHFSEARSEASLFP